MKSYSPRKKLEHTSPILSNISVDGSQHDKLLNDVQNDILNLESTDFKDKKSKDDMGARYRAMSENTDKSMDSGNSNVSGAISLGSFSGSTLSLE